MTLAMASKHSDCAKILSQHGIGDQKGIQSTDVAAIRTELPALCRQLSAPFLVTEFGGGDKYDPRSAIHRNITALPSTDANHRCRVILLWDVLRHTSVLPSVRQSDRGSRF